MRIGDSSVRPHEPSRGGRAGRVGWIHPPDSAVNSPADWVVLRHRSFLLRLEVPEARLEALGVDVARQTYRMPALEISRAVLVEQLAA